MYTVFSVAYTMSELALTDDHLITFLFKVLEEQKGYFIYVVTYFGQ